MQINLFVYPSYNRLAQESVPEYQYHWPLNDTVLFSQGSIRLVSRPEEADFFYMGQFGDKNGDFFQNPVEAYGQRFPYLQHCPERHIFQKDGDWAKRTPSQWIHVEVPDLLKRCIIITNNWKKSWDAANVYLHPCESRPFLSLMYRSETFPMRDTVSLSFRGTPDHFGVRERMVKAINILTGIPTEVQLITELRADVEPHDARVTDYQKMIARNSVALCPQGRGFDSIRFFEVCFFGRVPVIIGDGAVPGEDIYDTSFAFRVSPDGSVEQIAAHLQAIAQSLTPQEMKERGEAARRYFDHIVRPQLIDPTGEFIRFLQRRNLIRGFQYPIRQHRWGA